MKVIDQLDSFSALEPLALSLGMFDGVHLGHQSILSALKQRAKAEGLKTSILTFWPHPRVYFAPQEELRLLSSLEEKARLISSMGIEEFYVQEFNDAFRNLSGEAFVREVLVEKLNVKHLIVGYDHVFGKNRSGNFALLEKLGPELGFVVEQMEAVNLHEKTISSTKIRNLLLEGDIQEANRMLGYDYELSGKVVHGKKLGREIGFPTANLEVDPIKLVPKKGAYITDVVVEQKTYMGMLSIGTNPTVGGEKQTVEVNLLDFNQDLYEKDITVRFRAFLHEEIQFESIEKLTEKLQLDDKLTREFYSQNPLLFS